MRLPPLLFSCTICLFGCSAPREPDPTLSPLLDSIERRLALADAVALHKWDNRQPVQAIEREQQVLANIRRAAPTYQLDAHRAEAFFADQIEANKLVQYTLLHRWNNLRQAPDTPRRDLKADLRPQLDQLQAQLLQRLAHFDRNPPEQCDERLADALALRADALNRLALVRATGQLCNKP